MMTPHSRDHVPVEFVGLARVLRTRLALADAEARAEMLHFLTPLRPRPGFTPEAPRDALLRRRARRWSDLPSCGRLAAYAAFEGGQLSLAELRAVPTKMTFPGWDGPPEPAISIISWAAVCDPPHFIERRRTLADAGLHAVARRYQRGVGRDDNEVLKDLLPLGTTARAGEFAIPAGGGRWIGSVTLVRDAPVLAVRTFVVRE
jgi:hypothetical protein